MIIFLVINGVNTGIGGVQLHRVDQIFIKYKKNKKEKDKDSVLNNSNLHFVYFDLCYIVDPASLRDASQSVFNFCYRFHLLDFESSW